MKAVYPIILFLSLAIHAQAQFNFEVDGDADISGVLTLGDQLRINTTGTSVLRLEGSNPLIEIYGNSSIYSAFIQHFGVDFYVANRLSGDLIFRTDNINRMGITETGNVGIGTLTPASKLTVNGPENDGTVAGLEVFSGAQKIIMDGNEIDCVSGGLHLNANSNNDLLIRTTTRRAEVTITHETGSGANNGLALANPGGNNAYWTMYSTNGDGALELYYQGNLRGEFNSTTGNYTPISDRNFKENIRPLGNTLQKVAALKPSIYHFKNDQKKQDYVGFIAQELFEVFPEVVTKGTKGDSGEEVYTVDYGALSVIALAAVQELMQKQTTNQNLVQENLALKAQLDQLEQRLTKLESSIGQD